MIALHDPCPVIRRFAPIFSLSETNLFEEELLETFWLRDPEIEVHYVKCGANALAYLQQEQQKIPKLIVLAWRFRESQMSAMETLAALKSR